MVSVSQKAVAPSSSITTFLLVAQHHHHQGFLGHNTNGNWAPQSLGAGWQETSNRKHTVALGKVIKLKFYHCSFKQWENGIATTAKTLSVKAKCFKQSLEQWKRFPKTFENDEKVEAGVESSPISFIFPLHIMARFEQCDHTLKRIERNFSKESISTTC